MHLLWRALKKKKYWYSLSGFLTCTENYSQTGFHSNGNNVVLPLEDRWYWLYLCRFTWEESMATHSSILVWRIPQTEQPGRLQSVGLHRAGHDWSDLPPCIWPKGRGSSAHLTWTHMFPLQHARVVLITLTQHGPASAGSVVYFFWVS